MNSESDSSEKSRVNLQPLRAGFDLLKYLKELPLSARFSAFVIAAFLGVFGYIVFTGDSNERLISLIGILGILILAVVEGFRRSKEFEGKLVLDAPKKGTEDGKSIKYAYDLFVAVPMATLKDDTERLEVRKSIVNLIDLIKRRCQLGEIFYAAIKADTEENFDPPALGLKHNVPRIRASKRFLLIYPQKAPTGALIELGMALGLGKATTIFVKDGVELPYLLRDVSAGQTITDFPSIRTFRFRNFEQLVKMIQDHGVELFDDTPATTT